MHIGTWPDLEEEDHMQVSGGCAHQCPEATYIQMYAEAALCALELRLWMCLELSEASTLSELTAAIRPEKNPTRKRQKRRMPGFVSRLTFWH